MIQDGSHVRLHYTLSVDDRLIATTRGGEPFEYTQGTDDVVQGIEKNLAGLRVGEHKTFDVPPEAGYGSRDPSAVKTVPRSIFPEPDEVREGSAVTGMIDNQTVHAIVAQVVRDDVTLDFNHPLAGKTLHLEVEIVDVR